MTLGTKRFFSFMAVALVIPGSFGMAASKNGDVQTAQAQLLDQNEYECANCFFGTSDHYFCFRTDKKVLIGHEKIPTLNWRDNDKDYLTKYHKSWTPWQSAGSSVSLKYDDKYIYLPSATGKKDVRLTQDYTRDIFIESRECRAAVTKK
jgi:hypothetical protein